MFILIHENLIDISRRNRCLGIMGKTVVPSWIKPCSNMVWNPYPFLITVKKILSGWFWWHSLICTSNLSVMSFPLNLLLMNLNISCFTFYTAVLRYPFCSSFPLQQGASWGGAAGCIQESQNPRGGISHPPTLCPAFLHQRNSPGTPTAAKAPGPQHICWSLLSLLTLPSLPLPVRLPNNSRPLRHGPQWTHEVSAPAVRPSSEVHVHTRGTNRGVSQRLLTPAASDSLSLVWAAILPRPVAQTGAFADAQALLPVSTHSGWTMAQQGETLKHLSLSQQITYTDHNKSGCIIAAVNVLYSILQMPCVNFLGFLHSDDKVLLLQTWNDWDLVNVTTTVLQRAWLRSWPLYMWLLPSVGCPPHRRVGKFPSSSLGRHKNATEPPWWWAGWFLGKHKTSPPRRSM